MRKTADKIKNYLQQRPQTFLNDEAYQLASLKHAPDMAEVIWEIKCALAKGIAPERTVLGSLTTFILKDCEERPIAIFKCDYALNELAAYRLDHRRFAGVPQTVIASLEHPVFEGKKTGSCQYFIGDAVLALEIGRSLYKDFSSASVRRIATFDIRVMNEDRHSSNLLVRNQKELIPIDHGHIFPQDLSNIHLGWINWEQAATPFTELELSYLSLLDPEKDRALLIEELHLEEIIANRVFVSTILLKMAAMRGLTPNQIGSLMIRKKPDSQESSFFESLIENIKKRNPSNWQLFSRLVYEEIERLLYSYEARQLYNQ